MRGEKKKPAAHFMFSDFHAKRLFFEFSGFAVLENVAAIARNCFQQRAKILARMKLRLIGKLHARLVAVGYDFDEFAAQAKLARYVRIALQRLTLVGAAPIVKGRV